VSEQGSAGQHPDDGGPVEDPGADTERWQAFAARSAAERPKAVGAPFRILTLLGGLVVFVLIVLLLLR
jgi:hypothetical protein